MIPLRPHHALCITFFQGKGYSDRFVENMTEFVASLKGKTLLLVTEPDAVCSACPHLLENCPNAKKYDKLAARICEVEFDKAVPAEQLFEMVMDKIVLPDKLEQVCGDCEWFSTCSQAAKNHPTP